MAYDYSKFSNIQIIDSFASGFGSKSSNYYLASHLIFGANSNTQTIETYIQWIYDPLTRSAYADLRAGLMPLDYELEITNRVLDSNGTPIVNPKILQYTVYDFDYIVSGTIDGGTA